MPRRKERFNFQEKKSLHINLKRETHAGFRTELFKRHLTMQETLEEFASLVSLGHPRAMRILDDLIAKKENREVAKLSDTDADEIYRMLEEDSPFT